MCHLALPSPPPMPHYLELCGAGAGLGAAHGPQVKPGFAGSRAPHQLVCLHLLVAKVLSEPVQRGLGGDVDRHFHPLQLLGQVVLHIFATKLTKKQKLFQMLELTFWSNFTYHIIKAPIKDISRIRSCLSYSNEILIKNLGLDGPAR